MSIQLLNGYLPVKGKTLKIVAIILIGILLCSSGLFLSEYYRVKFQLSSPVVPKSLAKAISDQQIFQVIISLTGTVVAMALYLFRKYSLLICVAALTLTIITFIRYL